MARDTAGAPAVPRPVPGGGRRSPGRSPGAGSVEQPRAGAAVVLVRGGAGAGVHRHPDLPGLAVRTSPVAAPDELRLVLGWSGRLRGPAVVEVGALPAGWSRLKVAGVVVPAEVRRLGRGGAVLRWLDPAGSSVRTGAPSPAETAAGALAGALRTVRGRRRTR